MAGRDRAAAGLISGLQLSTGCGGSGGAEASNRAGLALVQPLQSPTAMHDHVTLSLAELATVTGGGSISNLSSIPGAWRPNSGMGQPPTPGGSLMGNLDKNFAAGEAAAQHGGGDRGIGGWSKNPMKEKPPLLY